MDQQTNGLDCSAAIGGQSHLARMPFRVGYQAFTCCGVLTCICQLLLVASDGTSTMLFDRRIVIALCFVGTMAAQPLVQIQPGPADIAAAGIKLAAINTPEHARKVAEILGDDANLLAPLLPYSVLLVNGSTKRLRGIGIFFRWENPEIAPRAYGLILSRGLDPEYSLRLPLPGEIKIFTPSPSATGYLSIPPPRRRQPLSGSTVIMATSFQDALQQDISRLSKYTNFRASIDGVLFEDYLYVGLSNVFGMLQGDNPEIHR